MQKQIRMGTFGFAFDDIVEMSAELQSWRRKAEVMDASTEKRTYVKLLIDMLAAKEVLLKGLLEKTMMQKAILESADFQLEAFEAILPEKERLIKKLERADRGFEDTYAKVQVELNANRQAFRPEIEQLQQLVMRITDSSVRLQSLEQWNRNKLESCLLQKRKEIKNFKISSQTAASYYKNMAGVSTDSVFVDKKK